VEEVAMALEGCLQIKKRGVLALLVDCYRVQL